MKKLLLVCAFVMGISALSYAQGGGRRTPEQQVAQLKEQVTGITDDQAAKIKALYEGQAKRIDSLRTASGADADYRAMMPKMMPIMATTNTKIKAVLTTEQAAAFQKVVDARNERMKQMMQGN